MLQAIHTEVLLQGFFLQFGLIVAIGAQNAFVLRQGIKRQHHLIVALICTLSDAILIVIGVLGVGTVIAKNSILQAIALWGGALFIFGYGAYSFICALKPKALTEQDVPKKRSRRLTAIIVTTLALTWLNPHVYVDTLIVIPSIAAQFAPAPRASFAVGTILTSVLWFFLLAFAASWLAPLFKRPRVWRILDIAIGCIMCFIAISIIVKALNIS